MINNNENELELDKVYSELLPLVEDEDGAGQ